VTPRQSNNPKRRLVPPDRLDGLRQFVWTIGLVYTGSALHKRRPGDYGFHPPVNPRAWKSLCDGHRVILKEEATALFREGLLNGFFSDFPDGGTPKYVWSVDADGEVYEAKVDSHGYHGYRLEEEDDFRSLILKEWAKRCSPP
jgi:hypothetical protein